MRRGLSAIKSGYPSDVSIGTFQVRGQSVAIGSTTTANTIGMVEVARRTALTVTVPMTAIRLTPRLTISARKGVQGPLFGHGEFRQQMQLPLGRSKFEAEAFAFNPATVAKSRLEAVHRIGRGGDDDADPLHDATLPGGCWRQRTTPANRLARALTPSHVRDG